jgi:hypothetical protein
MWKKFVSVSLSYCWHNKKSSSVLRFAWKSWKLTRNFSLCCAHDVMDHVMDLGGNLTYQLAAAFSRDMMNDLARVILSPRRKLL